MFLRFCTNEERRSYGGSAFLEIQHCKLPEKASSKQLVSAESVHNWELSSLYVYMDEIDGFCSEYRDIIGYGLYNNMSEGALDIYGINYYSPEKVRSIIAALHEHKPKEYEIFIDWLTDGLNCNGFYILGI